MKYWIITSEFPPAYGGGIGTYCYHTAKMLNNNGWEVTVFIPNRNSVKDEIQYREGIRVVEFHLQRNNVWSFLGFETALAYQFSEVIKEYLEKEGVPDILESQEYMGIAYYILQHKHLNYPLFRDLRVILTLHAPSFLYNDYNRLPSYQMPYFWIGEMERWCIMAADKLNAPSAFITNVIKPYLRRSLKDVAVVPLPFEQPKNSDFNNDNDPRANWFFFGKLTPQKGILPLLKAFRNLYRAGWEKQLYLIGSGDHYYHPEGMYMYEWIRNKYRDEIEKEKIVMLGSLSPGDWKNKTRNGAVILIPSIGDNYPYTVIESLINGNIVLASKQGGQSEIIKSAYNGFLFDHAEENDLIKNVKAIAKLSFQQIQNIRLNAITSVEERHSYNKVYPLKLQLINNTINLPRENKTFPFLWQPAASQEYKPHSEDTGGLLSIVIPYYNMGDYIEDSLQSIYASEYEPVEIIVVNDGSDDKKSIARLYELKDKYPFTIIEQTNKGLSEARNTGAPYAKGEYLAFLDPDDKVHPTYYNKAIDILKHKENVHFVGCWAQYFEKSKGAWPAFTPTPPYLLYHNMINSSALVYKKRVFTQNGWNDPALEYGVEDWESVINLVENGWNGVVIPEKLWFYRIRKKSMARSFTREKLLFSYNYIAQKHSPIYSIFAAELAGLLNANGPGYKIDNPTFFSSNNVPFNKNKAVKKIIEYVKKKPVLRKIAINILSKIKIRK